MKKLLGVWLALTMLLVFGLAGEAMAMPAVAEAEGATGEMSEQLAAVVKGVKAKIAIGQQWTDFSGSSSEYAAVKYWNLYWSGQDEQLNITVTDDGTITEYNWWQQDGNNSYDGLFAPHYPQVDRATAQKTAEAFVKKVLRTGETIKFTQNNSYAAAREINSYSFRGDILANGLASSLSFYIRVAADGSRITSFSRTIFQEDHLGTVPSAQAKITLAQAQKLLDGENQVRAAYYLSEDGKKAVLQYRPVVKDPLLVNAQSGQLIDLNALYADADQKLAGSALNYATADTAAAPAEGLSQAELSGVAQMSGVLAKDKLDQAVRGIAELKLGAKDTFANISYSADKEKDLITAQLTYWRQADAASLGLTAAELKKASGNGKAIIYKNCTVNAKTGELLSLYTNYPAQNEKWSEKKADQAKAEAFLAKYPAAHFEKAALSPEDSSACAFVYYQQVNGYMYQGNSCFVSCNPYSGEVDGFSYQWDEQVTFAPAAGIVAQQAALTAYNQALQVELFYASLPQAVDPSKPQLRPYADSGFAYVYQLALAYRQSNPKQAYGVDAASGKVLYAESDSVSGLTYDDITGNPAQAAIESLAAYGIGFAGGSFQPSDGLTQRGLLLFLTSAAGYQFDADVEDDALYAAAYDLGILTAAQRQPTQKITRGQYVQTLLDMSGYGKTAMLQGIYRCAYRDAAKIPAQYYGYAAIAQGLGMVKDANFNAGATITRAEAAVILDNFMRR